MNCCLNNNKKISPEAYRLIFQNQNAKVFSDKKGLKKMIKCRYQVSEYILKNL